MSHFRRLTLLVCAIFSALVTGTSQAQNLVICGGGKLGEPIYRELLALSKVKDPQVLVIPHAARPSDRTTSGATNVETFRKLGITRVEVLNLDDPQEARNAIGRAEVIWMSGGLQRLLIEALEKAGVVDTIRERVKVGVPIGGTSAGAAVMSREMIASSEPGDKAKPVMSHGLGLWPEVIVDQHFSQRDRSARLRTAIQKAPKHIGVGIDENTAVIYNGQTFRVIGEHTVTMVQQDISAKDEPTVQTQTFRAGEVCNFAASLNSKANGPGRTRDAR